MFLARSSIVSGLGFIVLLFIQYIVVSTNHVRRSEKLRGDPHDFPKINDDKSIQGCDQAVIITSNNYMYHSYEN